MMELFHILFIEAVIFVIAFAIALVVMFVCAGYCVLSGKIPPEKLKYYEEQRKKRKEEKEKKKGGSVHWLSYPSPLNNWGLWN